MNNPTEQNVTTPVIAPIGPPAAPDAITTRPPAAKGDDDLMSQPVKQS